MTSANERRKTHVRQHIRQDRTEHRRTHHELNIHCAKNPTRTPQVSAAWSFDSQFARSFHCLLLHSHSIHDGSNSSCRTSGSLVQGCPPSRASVCNVCRWSGARVAGRFSDLAWLVRRRSSSRQCRATSERQSSCQPWHTLRTCGTTPLGSTHALDTFLGVWCDKKRGAPRRGDQQAHHRVRFEPSEEAGRQLDHLVPGQGRPPSPQVHGCHRRFGWWTE